MSTGILGTGWRDLIQGGGRAILQNKFSSRLCWELEEPKGPEGILGAPAQIVRNKCLSPTKSHTRVVLHAIAKIAKVWKRSFFIDTHKREISRSCLLEE